MKPIESSVFAGLDEPGKAADAVARNATASLEAMAGARRRQAEKVMQAFSSLKAMLKAKSEELVQSRRETAEIIAEAETLRRNNIILSQNQRRLYLGFCSLLKSIEDTCGSEVAVDQRIEAAILSADIGNFLGEPADVSTAKARDFLAATQPSHTIATSETVHD